MESARPRVVSRPWRRGGIQARVYSTVEAIRSGSLLALAGALAVMAGMDAELSAALVGLGIVLAFGTLPLIFLLL